MTVRTSILLVLALGFLSSQRTLATTLNPAPLPVDEFLQTLSQPGPAGEQPGQIPGTAPAPANKDTCGGFTCGAGQSCYYCGTGLKCATTGSTCCAGGTTFCSPSQVCLYCNVSSSCQPPGSTCCNAQVCNPPHTCHNNAFCY